jgi:hypothetical protein
MTREQDCGGSRGDNTGTDIESHLARGDLSQVYIHEMI